jgi:hypothetical protein
MQCCKWEELGLLYTFHELDDNNARDFEEHLKECGECREELFYYREEKKCLFTEVLLGDSPSPKIDAAILSACSNIRQKASFFSLMPMFLRRSVVPVVLFAVAFISVGYVMMNMENARELQAASGKSAVQAIGQRQIIASGPAESVASITDSVADSVNGSKMNYAKTRGNLEGQGVVPVELKK